MGHSVLICDDTPAMRAMLRRVLEQGGFTVAGAAASASDLHALYAATRPDVVLLDLHMPDVEGLDLLRSLRAYDPPARVVICSGSGDDALRDDALALGAADWVKKPIFGNYLIGVLGRVVRG
jgi:two-component system chemotaxis response regulator CheY